MKLLEISKTILFNYTRDGENIRNNIFKQLILIYYNEYININYFY
jgi:hypothetical protein